MCFVLHMDDTICRILHSSQACFTWIFHLSEVPCFIWQVMLVASSLVCFLTMHTNLVTRDAHKSSEYINCTQGTLEAHGYSYYNYTLSPYQWGKTFKLWLFLYVKHFDLRDETIFTLFRSRKYLLYITSIFLWRDYLRLLQAIHAVGHRK